MIKGIGTDIVSIARIKLMIEKYGDKFTNKVFTDKEIEHSRSKAVPEIYLSGRWAAKEAFYKALPPECQSYSGWKSIQIISEEDGRRPVIHILANELNDVLKKNSISNIHLSISHERDHCTAVVLME